MTILNDERPTPEPDDRAEDITYWRDHETDMFGWLADRAADRAERVRDGWWA